MPFPRKAFRKQSSAAALAGAGLLRGYPPMAMKEKPAAKTRASRAAHAALGSRPVWQGHLRLSLVSCPIALYGATTRASDVSFHMLNPKTHNRIRMIATDPDTGPVERADLVKGYEIAKNKYVVVTNEEI